MIVNVSSPSAKSSRRTQELQAEATEMSVTTTPEREICRRGSRTPTSSPFFRVALTLPALLVTEPAAVCAPAAGAAHSSATARSAT